VKWISGRRPSPAMVVALIALFVSLSGVSYGVATGFIDSREIKNNEVRSLDVRNNEIRTRDLRNNDVRGIDIRNSTVNGRDVALNTLTGVDINESSLDKVPSAAAADTATSATTAGSANAVGGITMARIDYAGETGGPFVEILNLGGLRLEARCVGGPAMEVRANPVAAANSEISSDFGLGLGFGNDNIDFDPGDNTLVFDGGGNTSGQIAYAGSDGAIVTVEAITREDMNGVRGSTTADCGFFGFARAG
jgi:hypothetical protein